MVLPVGGKYPIVISEEDLILTVALPPQDCDTRLALLAARERMEAALGRRDPLAWVEHLGCLWMLQFAADQAAQIAVSQPLHADRDWIPKTRSRTDGASRFRDRSYCVGGK